MEEQAKSIQTKKIKFNVTNAAALLMFATFFSQLLGFLRTKLVNANFPIVGPHSTDAYFAAFNIPDLFFFTLSAGVLGVALLPVLSDRIHSKGSKSAWELATSILNLLAIVMFILGFLTLIFAHQLIQYIVAPNLPPADINTAADIMRFLAFNPLLFTISGILTSVQQSLGKFFFYAIAPLFYNTAIIISIFVFKDNIGIVGLGIGALAGAILQLIVVIIGAYNSNFHWNPRIMWRNKDFRTVLKNLPPRSLDQGMDQIEAIVETRVASGLGVGSITNYNNAYILSTAPILLLGTAISTAVFPKLSSRLSQNRPDLFRKEFLKVLRIMIWLSAPVVVIGYYCRGYLARLIYSQGNQQISNIFGYLALAIFFGILYSIISRWFYAHKDTKTPLFVSIFTIALNIFLAIVLSRPGMYGVTGLALAQSIVAASEVLILLLIMIKRDHKLINLQFISGLIRIISVTGFSMVAGFIMISLFPLYISEKGIFVLGSRLLLIAGVTMSVHILMSAIFDVEEVRPLLKRIKQIITKPVKFEI